MAVNPYALTEGVPAARVGERLVQARRNAGLGRWRAARTARVARTSLARIERGRMQPPDGTLIALCRAYDVTLTWLIPERSGNEVRVGAGLIEVAGRSRVLGGSGGVGDGDDAAVGAVLASYLAIVRELRGVAAGGVVSLRDEDLVALARALGDTPSEIEARLVDLMKLSRDEARAVRRELLKRRVAVPAAGLLLATAAVTGSLDAGRAGDGAGARHPGGGTLASAVGHSSVSATRGAPDGADSAPDTTAPAELGAPAVDGRGRAGTSTPAAQDAPPAGNDVPVVIGDAVSLERDDAPPPGPRAPRVVIALPAPTTSPAADDSSADAPPSPDANGVVDVAGSSSDGTTAGDAGTGDQANDANSTGTGTDTHGSENAHGANEHANPNAADAADNSDPGDEGLHAGASPTPGGDAASNAHDRA